LPASALAHGYAHAQEATEFGAATRVADAKADSGTGSVVPMAAAAEAEPAEHPHLTAGDARNARVVTQLIAMVAAHIALPRARFILQAPPQPGPTLQLRAEAAQTPPPRLRAPPALLG